MIFWKVFRVGSRVFGFVLAVASAGMAIATMVGAIPTDDTVLKWGIVSLLVLLSILGIAIVRSPPSSQK